MRSATGGMSVASTGTRLDHLFSQLSRSFWRCTRADAQDKPHRKLIEHLVQVLDRQRVALAPPPIGHHPVGQHDEIASVLMAVDGEPPEVVVLQMSHTVPIPALGTPASSACAGAAWAETRRGRAVVWPGSSSSDTTAHTTRSEAIDLAGGALRADAALVVNVWSIPMTATQPGAPLGAPTPPIEAEVQRFEQAARRLAEVGAARARRPA